MKLLSLTLIFLSFSTFAEEKASQLTEESEVVQFDKLREVLKKDMLQEVVEVKKDKVEVFKEKKNDLQKDFFDYPSESDFLGFISELWLVKQAPRLGWDFVKPEYGIENSLKTILQDLSQYHLKFKILYTNTAYPAHMALPLDGDRHVVFLISVPFMRSLDLSKKEIALLLFEDWMRIDSGYFKKDLAKKVDFSFLGTNFYGQKVKKEKIEQSLDFYSQFIFETGYQFQQQYEVTKKMDVFLKNYPELWSAYYNMLGKIDNLVKSNLLFKDYNKLYPSAEMQLRWLRPEKKFP